MKILIAKDNLFLFKKNGSAATQMPEKLVGMKRKIDQIKY
jgi:hypothetical protein